MHTSDAVVLATKHDMADTESMDKIGRCIVHMIKVGHQHNRRPGTCIACKCPILSCACRTRKLTVMVCRVAAEAPSSGSLQPSHVMIRVMSHHL